MDVIKKIPKVPTVRQIKRAGLNIVAFVPMARAGVVPDSFVAFWKIAQKGFDFLETKALAGRTDVNRNQAGHLMRENDKYTHVLMMDADHRHDADIIGKHARWVIEDRSKLVIGTLNFRRTFPFYACLFQPDDEGRLRSMEEWPRGLVRTPLMGHGSILIAREIFEQLDPPWWAYPYNHAAQASYPAEDTYFCFNLVRHEIDMWCDTTITSPHLSSVAITAETHRSTRQARQAGAS